MRLPLLLLTGLVALQGGCQSPPPGQPVYRVPIPDPARLAGFSPEEASAASKLYAIKCAKCHEFYNPAAYREAEWRTWMTKMSKKAHLKPDQSELLMRYLELFRPASSS